MRPLHTPMVGTLELIQRSPRNGTWWQQQAALVHSTVAWCCYNCSDRSNAPLFTLSTVRHPFPFCTTISNSTRLLYSLRQSISLQCETTSCSSLYRSTSATLSQDYTNPQRRTISITTFKVCAYLKKKKKKKKLKRKKRKRKKKARYRIPR